MRRGVLMIVYVNNEEMILPKNCTVEGLLEIKGINCKAAVWINGEQILLKDYALRKLKDQDQIRILRILGGG